MVYFTLLFIAIFTVSKVTSLSCSGQQPSGSASGDDIARTQQVTILQYCFIDDCTIMRTDTGEKLNIIYTSDGYLITTLTNGHTSMMIARPDNEMLCIVPSSELTDRSIVAVLVFLSLFLIISYDLGINQETHIFTK